MQLGELAHDMCLGKMLDKKKNRGELLPYLRNVNVRWFSFDLADLKQMRFEPGEEVRYGLQPGDLVVCEGGEPGRSAVWNGQIRDARIQKALHRIRFKTDEYDPQFACYYLYFGTLIDRFVRYYTGTTIKHLTGKSLRRVSFPIAPLVEQRAIVAKVESLFSELDQGVAQLEAARAQLGRYRQSVLKAAFEGRLTAAWRDQRRREAEANGQHLPTADVLLARIRAEREAAYANRLTEWERAVADCEAAGGKASGKKKPRKPAKPKDPPRLAAEELADLPELPEGWVWCRVGTALEEIFDGPFGSSLKTSDYVVSGVPVVRLENIGAQVYRSDKQSFVSESKYRALSRHWLRPRDVVFSSFIADEVRTCLVPESLPRAINKADCFCLRTVPTVLPRFLCASFGTRTFHHIIARDVHGATRPRVNTTQLREAVVPLCASDEQAEVLNEIDARLSVVDQVQRTITAALKQAEAMRQSILKKAFEGRLLSESELAAIRTDPAYEPADQLLARIGGDAAPRPKRAASRPAATSIPKGERYRQAACAAYAVRRLGSQPTFGRVQQMKYLYLVPHVVERESHIHAERQAAGPLDPAIHKIESLAKKQDWFTAQAQGKRIIYKPRSKIDEACVTAEAFFGAGKTKVDWLLDQFAKFDTERAELVATTFAVWNDLLIDGEKPVEAKIVAGVHGWHPDKAEKFPADRIGKCMKWLRDQDLVPSGTGPRTRAVEATA